MKYPFLANVPIILWWFVIATLLWFHLPYLILSWVLSAFLFKLTPGESVIIRK